MQHLSSDTDPERLTEIPTLGDTSILESIKNLRKTLVAGSTFVRSRDTRILLNAYENEARNRASLAWLFPIISYSVIKRVS